MNIQILFVPDDIFRRCCFNDGGRVEIDLLKFARSGLKFKFLQYDMLVSMTGKNNSHYYVTTVDLRRNTVTFRESIGNDLNPHQFALARCIATGVELLRLNLNVYGSSCQDEWRVLQSCNVTKQNDAISCGVIAIIYSLMICSGQENKYQIPFEKHICTLEQSHVTHIKQIHVDFFNVSHM